MTVQVSAPSEKPYVWLGEVFFYLDLDYLEAPIVRTHRFRASRLLRLGKPMKILTKEEIEEVMNQLEKTSV